MLLRGSKMLPGAKTLLRGSKMLPRGIELSYSSCASFIYVASLISHLIPRSNICLLINRFNMSTKRNNGQPPKIGINAMVVVSPYHANYSFIPYSFMRYFTVVYGVFTRFSESQQIFRLQHNM